MTPTAAFIGANALVGAIALLALTFVVMDLLPRPARVAGFSGFAVSRSVLPFPRSRPGDSGNGRIGRNLSPSSAAWSAPKRPRPGSAYGGQWYPTTVARVLQEKP
jgi:hypothetical protein